MARFPRRYIHIPELGNENYNRPELGIQIVNLERGIPRLMKGIRHGRTLIMMCGCKDYHTCHRSVLTQELLRVMPEADVTMPGVAAPAHTIKCLSIRQPWGYLIANGYKDVENRFKDLTQGYRGPVLIHVGAAFDEECFFLDLWDTAFLERVKVACHLSESDLPSRGSFPLKAIIGIAHLTHVGKSIKSPWFRGPCGLVFQHARAFEKPIAYSGKPDLFDVPIEVVSSHLSELDLVPSRS